MSSGYKPDYWDGVRSGENDGEEPFAGERSANPSEGPHPNHRPDLRYILGVLLNVQQTLPPPKNDAFHGQVAAAINGMRYILNRTEEAAALTPSEAPSAKEAREPVAWELVKPTGHVAATEDSCVRAWARLGGYKWTVEGLLGSEEEGWRVRPVYDAPPITHAEGEKR